MNMATLHRFWWCVWTDHKTSGTISFEYEEKRRIVELFARHAEPHIGRKPNTANQHKHVKQTVDCTVNHQLFYVQKVFWIQIWGHLDSWSWANMQRDDHKHSSQTTDSRTTLKTDKVLQKIIIIRLYEPCINEIYLTLMLHQGNVLNLIMRLYKFNYKNQK